MSSNKQEIKAEDFKPEYIGRGVWHSWQLTGFRAKTRSEVVIIYAFILMYVVNMICKNCQHHAKLYISNTGYIEDILNSKEKDLTDSEIIEQFNIWLYEFHKSANLFSGKSSPSYDEVSEFYLNLKVCTENCGN
uniref:thiol oxidase n=1 Tax=viral metagenome TaxID=1070528 RepID=A0A6C0BCU8_9ZZZZ